MYKYTFSAAEYQRVRDQKPSGKSRSSTGTWLQKNSPNLGEKLATCHLRQMTPSQNPTIGLLICKGKDNTEVQYAFNDITTPMGVASYNNIQIQKLQEQLPSIEELKARIRLLEEELEKKQE